MSLSKKEIKIISLLLLDSVFFFIEIIVGYAVNSLALIADSFHMLNDIISLLVALWAVNVAKNREADSKFTYGWQRAEILGALVNAVFLLALCFSIFIEAIQRFIVPAEITNAKLILIVGATGLVSNIVGLLLFHEHGHSHGSSGHSHGGISQDEESNEHEHQHGHSHSHSHYHDDEPVTAPAPPIAKKSLLSRNPLDNSNLDDIMPDVIVNQLSNSVSDYSDNDKNYLSNPDFRLIHGNHNHILKKGEKGASKSLNMQGVFLHVMGDALGNIGVMATAIFIWKTDYSWRFYSDPLVSLVITVIIFSSALPLCKSSSRILLQGTPQSVDFDDVKDDILQIAGVLSVHDFHIWNLTERVLIASLHVDLSISPAEFLQIASTIKGCLHEYGIHSATIQPEFSAYYAHNQVLPKRYSQQQLTGTNNSSKDNILLNSGSTNTTDESSRLLNSSNENGNGNVTSATTYGTSNNGQGGDIHCIVDAATGCTAADCVH